MKIILRTPLLYTYLSLFGIACIPVFASDITGIVMARGGNLAVTKSAAPLLNISYYDWGPSWSGVTRTLSGSEGSNVAYFSYVNVIRSTGTSFSINGSWRQTSDAQLSFEATLTPEGDSALEQSMFGLKVGSEFQGQLARIFHANGNFDDVRLPFPRRVYGDDVVRIELSSAPLATNISFQSPASVTSDRGELRMAIAKSEIQAGREESLAFTLDLPGVVDFIPGPVAAVREYNQSDWYAFQPDEVLPSNSVLRMDDWSPAPAGQYGPILRDAAALRYGDDPIKLWGLNNSYAACAPKRDLADKRADFYAAMGINAVRLHKYADGTGWKGILASESAVEFDAEMLDRMDYYVAALKEHGIFTKLSPVFIADIGPADQSRIPYADELGKPAKDGWITAGHGAIYLSRELQDLLIEQVQKLLQHKNPHTNLRYADDPAIAFVEAYNEDSALFGGINRVMSQSPTLRERAGRAFFKWLSKKYRTEDAFLDAWGRGALNSSPLRNQRIPQDESWAEGRIYPVGNPWFFDPDNLNTSQRRFKRRLLDTMAFLHDLQNDFYRRFEAALRATGYEGELIASNWQAGRMMSHFYNLHSDAQLGTIDRHNYFGGGARSAGVINSASMLSKPGSGMLSSGLQQVADRPFMLSEWIHVFPNEWGAEGPALLGAYGMGLQGWDVSFPFQNSDNGTFSTEIGRQQWDVTAPQFMGMFPAISRQVRRGDVSESSIVHSRNVHLPSLDEQVVGFDESVEQRWDVKTFTSDVYPAEALAAVKGVVTFTNSQMETPALDLAPYVEGSTIRSSTDELRWTKGDSSQSGFFTIDTPATQAVVGFADGERLELTDATIEPRSKFAALYLTALSQTGTIQSDSVLITAMARARNHDQIVVDDTVLLERGGKDGKGIVLEPVVAEITLKLTGSPTVHILDHIGVKTGEQLDVVDGAFTIDTGRDETPYYLIEWN